jgi:hypothetical protein
MVTLTLLGALGALVIGIAASVAGGAAGGILTGGKALGNELAALMGGFYGPLAGIGGTVLGLVVVALIG